jgi:hypothetical protein
MPELAAITRPAQSRPSTTFFPREHGATAMLLTPIACSAILAHQWRWTELATLTAAFAALAAKDPLVVLARQRFVWKQRRPETATAVRWLAGWATLLAASGLGLFFALAIAVNVSNRQRSTVFQIASAAALTSTSVATALSATGGIAPWCLWLWLLMAMQATAGILVVHARLDARIALRAAAPAPSPFRRAALVALAVLLSAALAATFLRRVSIALALAVVLAGYALDLHRQRNPEALQLPLRKVGLRALALSCLYAALLIVGLW